VRRGRTTMLVDEHVFGRGDYAVFSVLSVANLAALWVGLLHLLGPGPLGRSLGALFLLAPMLLMWELRWFALPAMRRPRPRPAPPGLRVAVVTTFVPAAEPIAMLEQSLRALLALDYPHDTWVLDEGNDPEVRRLCERVGAHHFSRRDMPEFQRPSGRLQARTKHGNYNAWFDMVGFDRYDAIATFDPDHIPRPGYLTRLLGYLDEPRVGFVQAPQVYYNQAASFIARGAAEETYAYYSSIQMVGYAAGFPVAVGCHTLHRTDALRSVGGLPAHDADDFAVTLMYLAAGWHGVYDPVPLAFGLTPVDWDGYLKQQRRWARSVLDLKLRLYPRVFRRLPPRVRVAAGLHGLYYLSGLLIPIALGYLWVLLISNKPLNHVWTTVEYLALIYGTLTICDLYRQRFFLQPRSEVGLQWRAVILKFAKWPWLLAAVFDVLWSRRRDYEITAKRAQARTRSVLAPHAAVALVLATWWIGAFLIGDRPPSILSLATAAVILISLIVAVSNVRSFPPPYDPALVPDLAHTPTTSEQSHLIPTSLRGRGGSPGGGTVQGMRDA
jgi:cellulose synthase (UDP-forming)